MKRWSFVLAAMLFLSVVALGCSGGGTGNPLVPEQNTTGLMTGGTERASEVQTHLWGYYDIYIDIPTLTVEAVPNRNVEFTANVTTFINKSFANLGFKIHGAPITTGYVDVDIDVSISHPIPGLSQYNGYDVRGVFMGVGQGTLKYYGQKYARYNANDQVMYDYDRTKEFGVDPYPGLVGMPDGYTRWYNANEFATPGLFGYTQGLAATKNYSNYLSATINPYKYFADGLGVQDDLYTWATTNTSNPYGIFSAGSTNKRNYYLRFPSATGIKYGYAVIADWKSIHPIDHPSNMIEAVAASCTVTDDVFYVNDLNYGGDLIFDISVVGHKYQPTSLIVESTVTSAPAVFKAKDVAVGGGTNYSTYHVEINADAVKSTGGNEFWVIMEYKNFYYINEYFVPNYAGDDYLAAFFRYDLKVSNYSNCLTPGVYAMNPNSAQQGSMVNDAAIIVSDLQPGLSLSAKLVKTGETDIIGSDVKYIGANTLTADFILTGAAQGTWDVVVRNGCGGMPGTGVGVFTVTPCLSPSVVAINPNVTATGSFINATITTSALVPGPGLTAMLFKGSSQIIGTNVTMIDSTHVSANFDLTNAALGYWSVGVTNGCGGPLGVGPNLLRVVECLTPTVISCDPNTGKTDGMVECVITLNNISDGASLNAKLVKSGQNDINAHWIDWESSTQIRARFILLDAAPGVWDLHVNNGCGADPGIGVDMFTVTDDITGLYMISRGSLPDPQPVARLQDLDFSVNGINVNGKTGVFYWWGPKDPVTGKFIPNEYYVYKYPLDYSGPGTQHMKVYVPWSWAGVPPGQQDKWFGKPSFMRKTDITADGSLVFTSGYNMVIPFAGMNGTAPVYYGAITDNGNLTNGLAFYAMQFKDVECDFTAPYAMRGHWGNYPAGIDGASARIDSPYGGGNYNFIHYYYGNTGSLPVDHVGGIGTSIDGRVSDNEAFGYASDSNPQGLPGTFNIINYYLEGDLGWGDEDYMDDPGIEIQYNYKTSVGPTAQGTIDGTKLKGIPCDISVFPAFGTYPSATGNWLTSLEGNELDVINKLTWQIVLYTQTGNIVQRWNVPINGDPIAVDIDTANLEIHVWVVEATRYYYYKFGWKE